MKFLWVMILFTLGVTLFGAAIDGSYSIVIPKPGNDPVLNRFDKMAAELFSEAAEKSAGVKIPVVTEDQYRGGKGVFIGNTAAAQKLGLDAEKLRYWECRVKADKLGSLYFFGRHSIDPGYPKVNHHRFRELGTFRGVCEFLREHTGMRVLLPGNKGRVFASRKSLDFNDRIDRIYQPSFLYVNGRPTGDVIYDIANGFLASPWFRTYGGHSHPVAVPLSLFEKHPEYFLQTKNGKRWKSVQYCLSNPEVQELIYQEMLKQLDRGFDWVQLAQTDGFSACSCKPCKQLYGISDWGEKMWILHRSMAERLEKDRPGKKVVILCYPPNAKPPKSFNSFPDNVIIELCRYTPEELEEWKTIKLPGGFVAYVYNWGAFGPESYTPRFSPEKSAEQVKLLKKYNVKGIYRCGFGEMFGLSGPDYYTYGEALNDPEKVDAQALVAEYCDLLYGNAAPAMKNFFRELYGRQQFNLAEKHDDYHRNLVRGMPGGYANHRLISLRYPADTISVLDQELRKAETAAPDNVFVNLVRREFDFLAVTAGMCRTFMNYIKNPSESTFAALKQGVEAREKFLKEGPQTRGHMSHSAGVPVCGGIPIAKLRDGGSWKAKFLYPLNWDLAWLEQEKIIPGARVLSCGGSAQKLIPAFFNPVKEEMATVRAEALPEGLKVTLNVPGITKREIFYVILENIHYVFRNTYKQADVYLNQAGKRVKGEGKGKEQTRVAASGNEVSCIVPWNLLSGGRPVKGKSIPFNIYRRRDTDRAEFIYEPDLNLIGGVDRGRGKLIF